MIVLDTNVVSEVMGLKPSPLVRRWLDAQDAKTLYLSTITVAELSFGISAMAEGRRKKTLTEAIVQLLGLFEDRTLSFDREAALRYAELAVFARSVGRGFPLPDSYIAAIAASRGFAVATRDASAFNAVGVPVVDPWMFEG